MAPNGSNKITEYRINLLKFRKTPLTNNSHKFKRCLTESLSQICYTKPPVKLFPDHFRPFYLSEWYDNVRALRKNFIPGSRAHGKNCDPYF